jgi:hypothetical protein
MACQLWPKRPRNDVQHGLKETKYPLGAPPRGRELFGQGSDVTAEPGKTLGRSCDSSTSAGEALQRSSLVENGSIDPDPGEVVAAWPTLCDAVRRRVLAGV